MRSMPDGVVLLDADNTIIWGNGRLGEWTQQETVVGQNFYAGARQPRDSGPRLLSVPHGAGHGQAEQLDAALGRRATTTCTPRRWSTAAAAAPDRHDPRRDDRGAAAAKAGRHPPGRHRAGRPDARRTVPDDGRRADRAAEVEHPALHARTCCISTSSRFACSTPTTGELEPLLAVGMAPEAAAARAVRRAARATA